MVTGDDRGGGVRYLARPPVPVSRPGQQDRHGSPALGVQPRRGAVEPDGERRPVAGAAEKCRTPRAPVRSQFTAADAPRLRPEASFDDIVREYLDNEIAPFSS